MAEDSFLLGRLRPQVDWEKDQERVGVLFSPFRNRELNPESWRDKDEFWRSAAGDWAKSGEHGPVTFTASHLRKLFALPDGAEPKCLDEVLARMGKEENRLIRKDRLMSQLDCSSSWWKKAARTVGGYVASKVWYGDVADPVYVWTDNLTRWSAEMAKRALAEETSSKVVRIGEGSVVLLLSHLISLRPESLSEEDWSLCLAKLVSEGYADIRDIQDERHVKMSKVTHDAMNDTDCAIVRLTSSTNSLKESVEQGERDRDSLNEKIKERLKAGHRASAKSLLLRRKRLEATLAKKVSVLDRVEELLSAIESAGENRDIVESYKAGQAALAASLEQNSIDDVLDLMDNLKELSEQKEEMSNALAGATSAVGSDVDDSELEKELERLLAGEKADEVLAQLDELVIADDPLPEDKNRVKAVAQALPE